MKQCLLVVKIDSINSPFVDNAKDMTVEQAIKAIECDFTFYNYLPYSLRNKKEIVLQYIKETATNGTELNGAIPFDMMKDPEILCKITTFTPENFKEVLNNKNKVHETDLNIQCVIEFNVSGFDENDKLKSALVEVPLEEAVKFNHNFFHCSHQCKYIHDNFDKSFLSGFISRIAYISESENNDEPSTTYFEYALWNYTVNKWLSINGSVLQFLPDKVKENRKKVEKAIEQNPLAIQFTTPDLQFEFINDCIEKGLKFKYLPKKLKNDPNIVLAFIKKNLLEFKFISPELQDNYEVAMTAVILNPEVYMYVSDRLKDDYNLAKVACGSIVGYQYEHFKNYMISSLRVQALLDEFCKEFVRKQDLYILKLYNETM